MLYQKRRCIGCMGIVFFNLLALLAVLSIFSTISTQQGMSRKLKGSISLQNESSVNIDFHESNNDYERRNMTGSWMGNTWIPPAQWHLFSVEEMQELYRGRRVMWFGDSTSRRTAMTLYSVLNATAIPHVSFGMLERDIDVNKRFQSEDCDWWKNNTLLTNETAYPHFTICRKVQSRGGEVTVAPGNCVQNLETFSEAEVLNGGAILSSFDVLVVSLGIWHDVKPWACGMTNSSLNSTVYNVVDQLNEVVTQHPQIRVIWRTGGWKSDVPKERHFASLEINQAIMDAIERSNEPRISYVNWGDAVAPRSFQERIKGDLKPHYGLEPRLMLLQMIANELERMDKLLLE